MTARQGQATARSTTDELLPEATRHLDYFQALTEVGKALTSDLEFNSVLKNIMKSVEQLLRRCRGHHGRIRED